MIKPTFDGDQQQTIDRATYQQAIGVFEKLMTVLHPFMPFVTEEIWHQLKDRAEGDDCIVSTYPSVESYDVDLIKKVDQAIDVVSKIRFNRNDKGMKKYDLIQLFVADTPSARALFSLDGLLEMVKKSAYLSTINFVKTDEVPNTVAFVSGTEKYFMEVNIEVDVEAEIERMEKELAHQKGFLKGVEKKLSNERFVNNAPASVVEKEKQKMADALARIKILEENLAKLKK